MTLEAASDPAIETPGGRPPQARGGFLVDAVLAAALIALAGQAIYYLVLGIDRPIIEMHGFRQTQTALSAYWLLYGGPWLAYETPVLGAPWPVPFEFPTFQLIVAGLARLGMPLDAAGRLISFGFFAATLVPLRAMLRDIGFDRTAFLIVAVLFVGSPLYVFWARTFMIESCAVFFSVLWLALLVKFHKRGGVATFVLALMAGCLAALTKSTTFAIFGGVAGLIFLAALSDAFRKTELPAGWRDLLLLGSLCAVPLAAGVGWVAYSDAVKLANPFAALLTSSNMIQWNYGTLAQRLSSAFWFDVVVKRMGPDLFGDALPLVPFVIGAGLVLQRFDRRILIAVGAFLLPLLMFTNLYFIHNYYANANAIFLLTATGLAIAAIFAAGWRFSALLLLGCFIVGQSRYLARTYDFYIRLDTRSAAQYRIAGMAKQRVPPGEGLLVWGDDWSSQIPYYSQRRSLAVAPFVPIESVRATINEPQAYFGATRLGGVITCGDLSAYPSAVRELIANSVAGRPVMAESGSCRLFAVQ